MKASYVGTTAFLPRVVTGSSMGQREAREGGEVVQHELDFEDLLRMQAVLKQNQLSINQQQLELRRKEIAQQARLQEREGLFMKRQELKELDIKEKCSRLVQIREESSKAALLQLEERAAQKLKAREQELCNNSQMLGEHIRGKFVQAQAALNQSHQTELCAMQTKYMESQEKLETTTRQLQKERRARQAAEEKLAGLCTRVRALCERHNQAQKSLEAEWEVCVPGFAKAELISQTHPAALNSTDGAVDHNVEEAQSAGSGTNTKDECHALTETTKTAQTTELQISETTIHDKGEKEHETRKHVAARSTQDAKEDRQAAEARKLEVEEKKQKHRVDAFELPTEVDQERQEERQSQASEPTTEAIEEKEGNRGMQVSETATAEAKEREEQGLQGAESVIEERKENDGQNTKAQVAEPLIEEGGKEEKQEKTLPVSLASESMALSEGWGALFSSFFAPTEASSNDSFKEKLQPDGSPSKRIEWGGRQQEEAAVRCESVRICQPSESAARTIPRATTGLRQSDFAR